MVIEDVVVGGVVDWTELSGVDVIDRSSLLDVTVIADDAEDVEEAIAEVEGTADDGTDRPVDVVAAVVAIVVTDMAVCETLRVVHVEEP